MEYVLFFGIFMGYSGHIGFGIVMCVPSGYFTFSELLEHHHFMARYNHHVDHLLLRAIV